MKNFKIKSFLFIFEKHEKTFKRKWLKVQWKIGCLLVGWYMKKRFFLAFKLCFAAAYEKKDVGASQTAH